LRAKRYGDSVPAAPRIEPMDEQLVNYACLYWHFTSLVPAEAVLMNDLTSPMRTAAGASAGP
jgi:hypothetical protein